MATSLARFNAIECTNSGDAQIDPFILTINVSVRFVQELVGMYAWVMSCAVSSIEVTAHTSGVKIILIGSVFRCLLLHLSSVGVDNVKE